MTVNRASADVLRLSDASVTYADGTPGLRNATLGFRAGEFTVLLGPSGAGKSTLLRSINGLVPLTSGDVVALEFGSIRDQGVLRRHRRATGMVFQQHQLIGRLSALRNVLVGRLGYHSSLRSLLPLPRRDRLRALEALDRVGLLDCALKRVDELSGGQQQRVGIARALAQQPRVLLADEPVASLDPGTALRVLELMHGICKSDGITAIVSLHQVEFARQFADRVVGVAGGSIVFDGRATGLNDAVLGTIYGTRVEESVDSVETTGPARARARTPAAHPVLAELSRSSTYTFH
jgi:phosphonate transport system ATP-binding protein